MSFLMLRAEVVQIRAIPFTYCFGGGSVFFGPLAGQLPVPRRMACTSIEAPGLPASLTSPRTCTDSPTCDASLDVSALEGIFSL